MTIPTLLSDLYARCGYTNTSVDTAVTARLTRFLNETLQDLISEPGLSQWITQNQPITFASVASQAIYALPSGVQRIDAISDRTSQTTLEMRDLTWYRQMAPAPATYTGTPSVWVPFGFMAVSSHPTAATGLWAVSSSAADVTQSVKLETLRTGGVPFSSALTLNGVTRVQLGTATDHEQITKFYVSAVAVGTISLYDAAVAGNVLGTIAIGQTFSRYTAIALWPTPAAAITYYVDGERDLGDMSNATDEPPLPARFHRLLIDGALAREWEKKDDAQRARDAQRRYERGRAQLRYFVTCPPDFLPARSNGLVERSRLGAYFPATRW